jgi:uncharacterized protein (TIGR03083 family)
MSATTMLPAREIPRPSLRRATEIRHAEVAAARELLSALDRDDWPRATACDGWTVHDVVAHMAGQWEELGKPWILLGRIRRARRQYPSSGVLDGHNRCQLDDRRDLVPSDLVAVYGRATASALRVLRRMPAPVRRVRLSLVFPEGKGCRRTRSTT